MVARLDSLRKEVIFSEPQIGGGRVKVIRKIVPICLENIDKVDFKWLCSLNKKSLRTSSGNIEYALYYDKTRRKAYFELNGSIKASHESFGFSNIYDGVTREVKRLETEVKNFRNNGKLYYALADILKHVKDEL